MQIETTKKGNVIVIAKGIEYKAIVHPGTARRIAALDDGDTLFFTDEQSVEWLVTRIEDQVIFEAEHRALTVAHDVF